MKRLGYEYSDDESVDVREMRTMAITQAAVANDERYNSSPTFDPSF